MDNLHYDILSIQERMNKRKAQGVHVINGCAGMLFDDEKKLKTFFDIDEIIRSSFDKYLAYSPVLGTDEYKNGVLSWLFDEDDEKLKEKYNINVVASLGGTGACKMLFSFLHSTHLIFLPDIRWPNYDTIVEDSLAKMSIYPYLDKDHKLDIEGIKKALPKDGKVLFVLNDPCENPLGYSLSREEYYSLFALLNEKQGRVSLLIDIAYYDYSPMENYLKELLLNSKINFDIYLAFSCSKSLSLYGLRLGALIAIYSKEKDASLFLTSCRTYARGSYSCVNSGAMGPISEFYSDKDKVKKVKKELVDENNRLFIIGKSMEEFLSEKGIVSYPYKGGFYLTFLAEDSHKFCDELEKKDIYFAPIDSRRIRIAISAISLNDIEEMKKRI